MPVQMQCNSCKRMENVYLIKDKEDVVCGNCLGIIPNASFFLKSQLKSLKEYYQFKKESFSVKCDCGHEGHPFIDKDNTYCNKCKKEITNITSFFKRMLVINLKEKNKDI